MSAHSNIVEIRAVWYASLHDSSSWSLAWWAFAASWSDGVCSCRELFCSRIVLSSAFISSSDWINIVFNVLFSLVAPCSHSLSTFSFNKPGNDSPGRHLNDVSWAGTEDSNFCYGLLGLCGLEKSFRPSSCRLTTCVWNCWAWQVMRRADGPEVTLNRYIMEKI